jgi:phosphopantothenoylcysteine decarboxylase/phosphopantothenate--cysteine ligase
VSHVVLGVAGGIAAYKSVELLRRLREAGHAVTVVPTRGALRFIGEPTWAALSGEPVSAEVWTDASEVRHVRLGQQADLILVAPATADLMARAVHGIADDLLTNVLLTARCPVVMAPAMHTEMWIHPATQHNVSTLRDRGIVILEPEVGRLTGADSGPGRLPEPQALMEQIEALLPDGTGLAGVHVLVTAGGTREAIDPVRFLGNHSSGRQGIALATAARRKGASVTLVLGHVDVPPPVGVDIVRVQTANQMRDVVRDVASDADIIVMAAAVADFRPRDESATKMKKKPGIDTVTMELVKNPDILRELVENRRPGQVIVGFAAETGDAGSDVVQLGREKLAAKGCDLLVVNEVGNGLAFGTQHNAVTVLTAEGTATQVGPADKLRIAEAIWDQILLHR